MKQKYIDMAKTGERQVATKLEDIRRDHVARYEFVNDEVKVRSTSIIDACCGIGYGSNIMAKKGHVVTGIDVDPDAINFAREYWKHPRATFRKGDLSKPDGISEAPIAVAFECIEHIEDPRPMLKALHKSSQVLFASVPNEEVFPFRQGNVVAAHHYRHYTKGQFASLLKECGWDVVEWFGQEGPESEVELNVNGRTLVAKCARGDEGFANLLDANKSFEGDVPKHVSIIGLGPSMDEYTNITRRLGGRHKWCDETWAINSLGSVLQCDRIFHMDDVRIQEIRAKALPESNTAAMLDWLKTTNLPVITSRPHPDYPTTEAFPLLGVLNKFDTGYFNSTAAYAVAYAIYIGVERLSLFGIDFTYPDAHDAEKGRACVEFWLGIAAERGIKLVVPKASTLLDALHTQAERFYGYDTLELDISQDAEGKIDVKFTERAQLPSAEQVEENYNHNKHPNALMSEVKDGQETL